MSGTEAARHRKTVLATSRLARGVIPVVLLKRENGKSAAYFSTDVEMEVKPILETGADRWAIRKHSHDVRSNQGSGSSSYAIFGRTLATGPKAAGYTQRWRPVEEFVDRTDRRWGNPCRRSSHADRPPQVMRQLLEQKVLHATARRLRITRLPGPNHRIAPPRGVPAMAPREPLPFKANTISKVQHA